MSKDDMGEQTDHRLLVLEAGRPDFDEVMRKASLGEQYPPAARAARELYASDEDDAYRRDADFQECPHCGTVFFTEADESQSGKG